MPQSILWMHRLPLQWVPKNQAASFYGCKDDGWHWKPKALLHHFQPVSGRLEEVNLWAHTSDTWMSVSISLATQKGVFNMPVLRAFYQCGCLYQLLLLCLESWGWRFFFTHPCEILAATFLQPVSLQLLLTDVKVSRAFPGSIVHPDNPLTPPGKQNLRKAPSASMPSHFSTSSTCVIPFGVTPLTHHVAPCREICLSAWFTR